MYCYPKGTDIIIYGSNNKFTKKLILQYGNYYKIHYIAEHLCSVSDGESVLGIPMKRIEKDFYTHKHDYKIIIAYDPPDASTVFRKNGFVPVKDYIPRWLIEYDDIDYIRLLEWFGEDYIKQTIKLLLNGRKGCVLHGNCQTRLIDIYLKSNLYFRCNYGIIKIPRIFEFNAESIKAVQSPDLWDNIYIYIYHDIKKNNKFGEQLASEHFKKFLKPSSISLCITNLWFTGYFPQRIANSKNVLTEYQQSGLFPNGDCNIDKLVSDGESINSIIEKVSDYNFYDRKTLIQNVNAQFADLEKREQICDIKMLDFIKKNYRKHLLFHSPNHPTHLVMKEVTRRLLIKLGINDTTFQQEWWCEKMWNLRGQDMTIYPSVIKHLKLKLPVRDIDDMVYFSNNAVDRTPLSFEEWIKRYIIFCHNDKYRL